MEIDSGSGTGSSDIDTDICVIGAGPAGITFAREFIGRSLRVVVLESGLTRHDARTQELSASSVDSPYHAVDALAAGRRRQVGGTSNLWVYEANPGSGRLHARSLPPEAHDLDGIDGRPESGWPFPLPAIEQFYQRAQTLWNGAPADYRVERWADAAAQPLPFPGGLVTTRISQHGPGDIFSVLYRDELLAAENVALLTGSTALRLEADEGGRDIRRVRVARSDGSMSAVTAKVFILAAGGVENAQLMLLSQATAPGGPGNLHDNVGRYLTDHPEFRMGTIMPADPGVFESIGLYDIRVVNGVLVSGLITLHEEAKTRDRRLNVSAVLVPQPSGFGSAAHKAILAVRSMPWRDRSRAFSEVAAIGRSPRDGAAVIRMRGRRFHEFVGGWSRPEVDRGAFRVIEVHAATEQSADRENRITLGDHRDRLGRRQAHLRWRWTEDDRSNISGSIDIFATEFQRAGVGRFTRWGELDGRGRPRFGGLHHPMGGTRMHAEPRHGVVDSDGLVHGLSNLYAAGSSVFPSGHGYANPTLSVLALTIRLADHLKARMSVG